MIAVTIFLLAFISAKCASAPEKVNVRDVNNITIAFGSCTDLYLPRPILTNTLTSIIKTQPDVWIWTGDAVYLDGKAPNQGTAPGPEYDIKDGSYVQKLFGALKADPTYTKLRTSMPVLGTWDDHDYAFDNADGTFLYKKRNMKYFLDFLDVPKDSPRRKQQGVYTSYYIGAQNLIKVILLDVRYNKSPQSQVSSLMGLAITASFGDMLGDQQWSWLEDQLNDPSPLYTLIITGTQCFPDDRILIDRWFDDSRQKLFDMIVSLQKSGVIVISGDAHYAEIMKHFCPERIGYKQFYEFTSSGMTHYSNFGPIANSFGFSQRFSTSSDRYFGYNFGIIKLVDGNNGSSPPDLVFEARNGNGNVVLSQTVSYSDVQFNAAQVKSKNFCNWKKLKT